MLSPSINEITGKPMVTGSPSKAFLNNFNTIFGESKLEKKARLEREAKEQQQPDPKD